MKQKANVTAVITNDFFDKLSNTSVFINLFGIAFVIHSKTHTEHMVNEQSTVNCIDWTLNEHCSNGSAKLSISFVYRYRTIYG